MPPPRSDSAVPGPSFATAADVHEQLRATLVRVVARVCPAWLANQRDDIVQSAWLRVQPHLPPEGNPPLAASYLSKVAYSALVDEIRRLRRLRETELDAVGDLPADGAAGGDPERRAEGRRISDAIRGCLAALVPDRKSATTLHLLGHSVPDVARLMTWNEKRAENLVYRGLADLRKCLLARGVRP